MSSPSQVSESLPMTTVSQLRNRARPKISWVARRREATCATYSSARFVARDSSTTTSSFVFFIENSSPRQSALGPSQLPSFQKKSRTVRLYRNYLPDDATSLRHLTRPAATPDRVRDA